VAEQECLLMLIERKTTQHTGDVVTEKRARSPISFDRVTTGTVDPELPKRTHP
jgi:hypothetical protein